MAAVAPINVRGWNDMRQDANDIIVKGLDYVMPQTAVGEGGKSIPQHIANLLVGSNMEKPQEAFVNGMINNINPVAQVWPKARYDMVNDAANYFQSGYIDPTDILQVLSNKFKNFDETFKEYTSRAYEPTWTGFMHPSELASNNIPESTAGAYFYKTPTGNQFQEILDKQGKLAGYKVENPNIITFMQNLIDLDQNMFYNTLLHEPTHHWQKTIPKLNKEVALGQPYNPMVYRNLEDILSSRKQRGILSALSPKYYKNLEYIENTIPDDVIDRAKAISYLSQPQETMARGISNEIMNRQLGDWTSSYYPLDKWQFTQSWHPDLNDTWKYLTDEILKLPYKRGE